MPADTTFIISASVDFADQAYASNFLGQFYPNDSARCVAKAGLYETVDTLSSNTVYLGQSETVLLSRPMAAGQIVGGIFEFTVRSGIFPNNLQIRTSVSDSGALQGSWSDPVAWPVQEAANSDGWVVHQRGWWPYSAIALPIGTFDVKPVYTPPGGHLPTLLAYAFRHNSGCPELSTNGGFGHQSSDTWGTSGGGKGAWGAKLSYTLNLVNTTTDGQTYFARIYLTSDQNPGHWEGAAFLEAPFPNYQYGSPPISQGTPGATTVELTAGLFGFGSAPIGVPAGGNVPVKISLETAGESSLPLIIAVTNTLDYTDPQNPGN